MLIGKIYGVDKQNFRNNGNFIIFDSEKVTIKTLLLNLFDHFISKRKFFQEAGSSLF